MTTKPEGTSRPENRVECTCDLSPTKYVNKGFNCAYHRKGCPAREYWETRND